jgi:DeoR/GlpR family transcriptional regulator of sugar metabolism
MQETSGRASAQRRRRAQIVDLVQAQGFQRIDELAERLSVSAMTIHRDLDDLVEQGLVRKVRGGAQALPAEATERNVRFRMQHMREAKQAIAEAAAAYVEPGSVVALDDSTTAASLLPLLRGMPLTVVTNFLPSLNMVAGEPQMSLIALGGLYSPSFDSFVGPAAVAQARALMADIALLSVPAVTKLACYHQSTEAAEVKRALIESAHRRILLVDHTKLERRALHKVAALEDFDLLVVDADIAPERLRSLQSAGIPVQVAPPAGGGGAERPVSGSVH